MRENQWLGGSWNSIITATGSIMAFSVLVSVRASLIGLIGSEEGLSPLTLSIFINVETIGFLLGNRYGNKKISQNKIRQTSILICLISIYSILIWVSIKLIPEETSLLEDLIIWSILLTGPFFYGFSTAVIQMLGNKIAIHPDEIIQKRRFTLIHISYGLLALIALNVLSPLIRHDGDWWWVFLLFCATPFMWMMMVLFVYKPQNAQKIQAITYTEEVMGTKKNNNKQKIIMIMLAMGFFTFSDSIIVNFLVHFLKNEYLWDSNNAIIALSVWFGAISLGRALGAIYAHRFHLKHLSISTALGYCAILIPFSGFSPDILIIPLLALASVLFAPLFPFILASSQSLGSIKKGTSTLTLVISSGGVGIAIGSMTGGLMFSSISPAIAMSVAPIGVLFASTIAFLALKTK